jgi:hypothetical protein
VAVESVIIRDSALKGILCERVCNGCGKKREGGKEERGRERREREVQCLGVVGT